MNNKEPITAYSTLLRALFEDPALIEAIEQEGVPKSVAKDVVLMEPGNKVYFVPIVLEGALRIIRPAEDGRQVFLYHLQAGQTCALSLSCCQAASESQVRAIAEVDTKILLIPAELIDDWSRQFREWKNFLNQTYFLRFQELLSVVDLVAFQHMDDELLNYLKKRAESIGSHILDITHQQIADELHTQREAISRLLRTMEQKGFVHLGRGHVELLVK